MSDPQAPKIDMKVTTQVPTSEIATPELDVTVDIPEPPPPPPPVFVVEPSMVAMPTKPGREGGTGG